MKFLKTYETYKEPIWMQEIYKLQKKCDDYYHSNSKEIDLDPFATIPINIEHKGIKYNYLTITEFGYYLTDDDKFLSLDNANSNWSDFSFKEHYVRENPILIQKLFDLMNIDYNIIIDIESEKLGVL